ncbi:unnamed protein product, partial [Ectocarpus sp. 13 AM-2016]
MNVGIEQRIRPCGTVLTRTKERHKGPTLQRNGLPAMIAFFRRQHIPRRVFQAYPSSIGEGINPLSPKCQTSGEENSLPWPLTNRETRPYRRRHPRRFSLTHMRPPPLTRCGSVGEPPKGKRNMST